MAVPTSINETAAETAARVAGDAAESGVQGARSWLGAIIDTVAVARETSTEVDRLMALSDAELAERGMERSDVVRVAARRILNR